MADRRDYQKEISDIADAVCTEIEIELKRIGKDFDSPFESDEGDIEFFQYPVIEEMDIEIVRANGMVKRDLSRDCEETSFRSLVSDDLITISDAIGFLNDLRDYESVIEA
jgi:hypothetical protein